MSIDLFDLIPLDLNNITCHSGGAEGSDSVFENRGEKYGVRTKAYSYKTPKHKSPNKVEISDEDYREGVSMIYKANHSLNRYGIEKYMNLLARNWAQVKYSSQIFAVGRIVSPGQKTSKGYYCRSKYQSVDGGTGYAIQLAIDSMKDIYVFDQVVGGWFRWSYSSLSFVRCSDPKITVQNFAGIGTREINQSGISAIVGLYEKTFERKDI
jgi:hypothetical protein